MYQLNATRRLIKKSDFDFVFSKAKKIVCGHFTLLYRANSLPCARLGFAISKRFVAKAVLRNKIRRIYKESFRIRTNVPAYDMVIIANKSFRKQDLDYLKKNVEQLWQKLNSN